MLISIDTLKIFQGGGPDPLSLSRSAHANLVK